MAYIVQDYYKEPVEALSGVDCFIVDESPYNDATQDIDNFFINNEYFNQMGITNGGGGGANKQSFHFDFR